MVILKIGGTSMGSAARMDAALDIAEAQLKDSPLMVCSAMGGVTDQIIEACTLAQTGRETEYVVIFEDIRKRHESCARDFLDGEWLDGALSNLDNLFAQFASLLKGVSLLRECSPRSQDALLSFGERLSTNLIHARARVRRIDADLLDARSIIRTDLNFTAAYPDMGETQALAQSRARPCPGRLLITQGFIGSGPNGVTTTLGRGGSDYSASILGAALNATEIQIWTDVNGIMTSDPRHIPEAVTISEITYDEAGELAYFGAKVVHPATIQPAVARGIPVRVKNTAAPEEEGTLIAGEAGKPGIKAISTKAGITLVSITSFRMLEAHGFLQRIFAVFDDAKTPVDLVATSEVSVSMTIEKTDALPGILSALNELGRVTVEDGMSIICLVGRGLWKDPQFSSRVFEALGAVPVRMISLGASEVNLSLVVPETEAHGALKHLHDCLFNSAAPS